MSDYSGESDRDDRDRMWKELMSEQAQRSAASTSLWRWIVALLFVVQSALIGAIYHSADVRMTQSELREVALADVDRTMMVQIAAINANQIQVMKGLDINGQKLDDLLKTVYSVFPNTKK